MFHIVSFIYDIGSEIGYKFVEISIRQGKKYAKNIYSICIISLSFDIRWVIYKINILSEILRMRKIRFDLLFSICSDERFIHYSLCKHFHLNFFFWQHFSLSNKHITHFRYARSLSLRMNLLFVNLVDIHARPFLCTLCICASGFIIQWSADTRE